MKVGDRREGMGSCLLFGEATNSHSLIGLPMSKRLTAWASQSYVVSVRCVDILWTSSSHGPGLVTAVASPEVPATKGGFWYSCAPLTPTQYSVSRHYTTELTLMRLSEVRPALSFHGAQDIIDIISMMPDNVWVCPWAVPHIGQMCQAEHTTCMGDFCTCMHTTHMSQPKGLRPLSAPLSALLRCQPLWYNRCHSILVPPRTRCSPQHQP